MSKIFISYRRDDSGGWAGRLYDRLSQHFGRDNVFMDIDTIEPGLDFVEVIQKAVGSCEVLIALIGRQWLTVAEASGRRRLENLEDFVRLEIVAALDRNIRVIPALVQGTHMPRSTELPDVLQRLARRNALDISDTRFHQDVDRLIQAVEQVLRAIEAPATQPTSKAPEVEREVQNEEGSPPVTSAEPARENAAASLPFEPEMILIPAGEFLMGSDPQKDTDAVDNEQPQHTLYLPDYCLAKTPATNAQYAAFVQASGYQRPQHWTFGKPPHKKQDHPVVNVSWYDALAYCRWLSEVTGKAYRLPSEAQWEKGARGTDGRIYPWGNPRDAKRCNVTEGFWKRLQILNTTPVWAYLAGASPYGILDMAGNAMEWTRSLWGGYPYPWDANERTRREDLQAPNDQARVLRGGDFGSHLGLVRCAYRVTSDPYFRYRTIGFRVVMYP